MEMLRINSAEYTLTPEENLEKVLENEEQFMRTHPVSPENLHLYDIRMYDEFDVNDDVEIYER